MIQAVIKEIEETISNSSIVVSSTIQMAERMGSDTIIDICKGENTPNSMELGADFTIDN